MQRWVNFNWIKTDMPDKISFFEENEYSHLSNKRAVANNL